MTAPGTGSVFAGFRFPRGWFAEETCLGVAGQWACVDRAVAQRGQVIGVLVSDPQAEAE